MCKVKKRKVDKAVSAYKIFLVLMILSQVYCIIFDPFFIFGTITHGIMLLYLLFRYYILGKTASKAHNVDFTLTEFLNDRLACKECVDGCDCCD